MIVDPRTRCDARHFSRKVLLENDEENERLMDPGVGHYVLPKPNRLVLIASGNQHMIAKVSDAAGNNARAVYSGFFLKADAVKHLLT